MWMDLKEPIFTLRKINNILISIMTVNKWNWLHGKSFHRMPYFDPGCLTQYKMHVFVKFSTFYSLNLIVCLLYVGVVIFFCHVFGLFVWMLSTSLCLLESCTDIKLNSFQQDCIDLLPFPNDISGVWFGNKSKSVIICLNKSRVTAKDRYWSLL